MKNVKEFIIIENVYTFQSLFIGVIRRSMDRGTPRYHLHCVQSYEQGVPRMALKFNKYVLFPDNKNQTNYKQFEMTNNN